VFELRLTKLRPMATAIVGAGLLLSLSACPAPQSNLLTIRDNQDISEGTLLLSSDLPEEFSGRIEVFQVNEDGLRGEVIGTVPAEREFTGILIKLDLTKATEVLHIELFDERDESIEEHRVSVVGIGTTLAIAPTTNPPTSAPASPTLTPVPETAEPETDLASTFPIYYSDPHQDCHHFNGDTADCEGIDVSGGMLAIIREQDEWFNFLDVAAAEGFFVPEIQIPDSLPFIIGSLKINDFDPAGVHFCFVWASPPENAPPSVPDEDVIESCYWPDGIISTTIMNADGERISEFDPPGTWAWTDFKTGLTLIQYLDRIYAGAPSSRPIVVLAISSDNDVLDDISLDSLETMRLMSYDF